MKSLSEVDLGKLTALKVKSLKEPGRYTDGRGLMVVIGLDGSRKWVLRIQNNGVRRDIGLGPLSDVSLAEAREAALEVRKAIRAGRDPVAERREARASVKVPTFRETAQLVHEEHSPSWRNAKHRAQWLSSLKTYVFPKIGDIPVDHVTVAQVRDLLAEFWLKKPETARRVQQRIGIVLDFAHAKGWRPTEAPRGLARGLPKQSDRTEHFKAMPWQEVPAFLRELDATTEAGAVKLALRFLILTAARSGEVRGARWSEIDPNAEEWRIPGERMKGGRPHTVPLSPQAFAVLRDAAKFRTGAGPDSLIFEGRRKDQPLSDMAITMLLRRMGAWVTAHGFRSSFRDWAAEATDVPREVAEAALAHVVESKVEAAYRRSDLLERRRALMVTWGDYCDGENGDER